MNSDKLLTMFGICAIIFIAFAAELFMVYKKGPAVYHAEEYPEQSDEDFFYNLVLHWLIVVGFGIATAVCAALYIKCFHNW